MAPQRLCGPNQASYDPETETLRMADSGLFEDSIRYIEFTKLSGDKVTRTITDRLGDVEDTRVKVFVRGQRPQGCLARKSARVHSRLGTWKENTGKKTATAVKITEDQGGNRVVGSLRSKHQGGQVNVSGW